jgi:hypothetical protein
MYLNILLLNNNLIYSVNFVLNVLIQMLLKLLKEVIEKMENELINQNECNDYHYFYKLLKYFNYFNRES